jgi:hypothetical protein
MALTFYIVDNFNARRGNQPVFNVVVEFEKYMSNSIG